MYVSESDIGKTYRGTQGFVKGLLFKVLASKDGAITIKMFQYDKTMNVSSADFLDCCADEVK